MPADSHPKALLHWFNVSMAMPLGQSLHGSNDIVRAWRKLKNEQKIKHGHQPDANSKIQNSET